MKHFQKKAVPEFKDHKGEVLISGSSSTNLHGGNPQHPHTEYANWTGRVCLKQIILQVLVTEAAQVENIRQGYSQEEWSVWSLFLEAIAAGPRTPIQA